MEIYNKQIPFDQESFSASDHLQLVIFNYIDKAIRRLDEEESKNLIDYFNNKMISNYEDIIERNKFLKNKYAVDLHLRFNPTLTERELFEQFDTTVLKNGNYVYESLIGMLKEKDIDKGKRDR